MGLKDLMQYQIGLSDHIPINKLLQNSKSPITITRASPIFSVKLYLQFYFVLYSRIHQQQNNLSQKRVSLNLISRSLT